MTDQVIVDAAARFAKKPMPLGVDPLWTRTPDETRALYVPSVKALPFTSEEKGAYGWPEAMWADVPTDDYQADRARGKGFAAMTIRAICADRPIVRPLEKIFQAIVNDAIRRKAKGGKGSRSLPGAVDGLPGGTGGVYREPMPSPRRTVCGLTSPRRGAGHACPAHPALRPDIIIEARG
jgi:hypothetical protein